MTAGLETALFESAAKAVITKASPKILEAISKRLSKGGMRLKVQFTKTFQSHLARSMERSAFIKTVVSRDKPVDLESIYVPLTLQSSNSQNLHESHANPCSKQGARIILSGTGGAGKTILMKHLLNQSGNNNLGLIPIFIELRNMQFDSAPDLQSCMFKEFEELGDKESSSLFEVALEEGLFAIFLDGFDEIHPEEHERALRYIKNFSERFSRVSILVSTRPKTAVETLREYTVYHLEPLSKDQAISLVEKTEFEEVTKAKFLSSLNSGLFEKHRTLMSLPILLGMMLLAYRTYADIPDRMTVFYSQAFETLYSIHDAENKDLFKRQHHAGLAPDVFKSVLQAFCYLSLSNHDIEFTESTLNDYVSRALAVAKIDVPAEKYKNDLIHNVCVLQPDGLSYVFVHRSFQEYFASLFAVNYSGSQHFAVFDQIIDVSGSAVARMMLEIDTIKTRRYWLLPKAKSFLSRLRSLARKSVDLQIGEFCNVIWVEEKTPSTRQSYTFGGSGDHSFRVMSLLTECLNEDLSYASLVGRINIPKERETKKLAQPIKQDAEAPIVERSVTYGHQRAYRFQDLPIDFYEQIGFVDSFREYRSRLTKVVKTVEQDVTSHTKLEDTELFA